MSELLQTGQHPDADQLSAFVEHALPAHEHGWMLAHLAVCPDCRSVVALSMPPVEELPEIQRVPVRKPWFSGWRLVWPVAAAFAALLLIAVLVRKGSGNAPPTQIAEAHLPEKPVAGAGVAPPQAGLPSARGASPSPTGQYAVQAAKSAAGRAPAKPKVEGLPLNGRNSQPLPPSAGAAPQTAIAGRAMGNASGLGFGQQAQVPGSGLNVQQQTSVSAGMSVAAPSTEYSMARPVEAPLAPSPALPSPRPSAAMARSGNGSTLGDGALRGAAADAVTVDATSDDALAAEPVSNASAAVISGTSLAGLALTGNVALHPLPSELPALSVATAGETMLALDSGKALFLSSDAGAHWKRVRAKWRGRAVNVALAATPVALTPRPVAVNKPAIRGALEGRVSTATATEAAAGGAATLTGRVTDPAGAVIPGAMVTVTNVDTAAAVTVTTDAGGRYFAGGLAAGAYRLDATARGFARQELNLTLAASQQGEADLKLQVGQMSETVTVTSAPPQIDTENSSLSAEVLKSKPKRGAPPVFAITTDAGERWVSADGQSWKRE